MNNIKFCNTQKSATTSPPQSTLTIAGNWFGRIIHAGLSFLYNLPISIAKIISCMFVPAKEPKTNPLKEKLIEPIPTPPPEEPKLPPGPLDLSSGELLLCASGLFRLANATTGLPWGMQWLGGSTWATIFFCSATLTNPTTPMGILMPLMIARLNSRLHTPDTPSSPQADTLTMLSFGCAPIATAKQTHLTYRQTQKALKGIKTCIDYIGDESSLIIARNLAVHSVNIVTAGFNLLNSLKVSGPEFLALASYALKHTHSEEYAYQTMGAICPVPFMPQTSANTVPPLSDNPSLFEKANFAWSKTYNFLTGGPIAQCHYPPGSKGAQEYQEWSFKQDLKILGSDWFGISN